MKNSRTILVSVMLAIVAIMIIGGCKKEAKATCSDGVKNGTETEVDCGGSCTPCPTNSSLILGNWQMTRIASDSVGGFSKTYVLNDTSEFITMSFRNDNCITEYKQTQGTFIHDSIINPYSIRGSNIFMYNTLFVSDTIFVIRQLDNSNLTLWNLRVGYGGIIYEMVRE